MKVLVLNGPNLNLLGIREPEIYGTESLADLERELVIIAQPRGVELVFVQSNHEGVLIDWLQQAFFENYDGVIFNPGAYTHYSYAIHDAVASITTPVIEVHLSDITQREAFRQHSVLETVAMARFYGKHFQSYHEALYYLIAEENTK
ncbi:MAG: type II 3-dehydroquinate dehydratase [Culicoidibacterales bacterium]